ncbi:MAG TPA: flagellar hook protein FlgE [Firmicutes bacterium]|nr:flagellar hook protein FlgE [Bacillota bacterium]
MMRSLYAGVTGMQSQQMLMDVIGSNIANVSTVGYKSARVCFADLLNQTIRGASATTNPMQIGTGVRVGAVNTLYHQGSMQASENELDLGIVGKGFIVLQDGDNRLYTRAASLSFDAEGYLVHTATGLRVLGWRAQADGTINIGTPLAALRAGQGEQMPPTASTGITFDGSFDARLADGEKLFREVTVIDGAGRGHSLVMEFTRISATQWNWNLTAQDGTAIGNGAITFDGDGKVTAGGQATVVVAMDDRTNDLPLNLDFSTILQVGGDSSVAGYQIGGMKAGNLYDVSIDEKGILYGIYDNGVTRALGQVALAIFANQEGLERKGNNLFAATMASGEADTKAAAGVGRGLFSPRSLEMSNVDLSREFVSMIISQRAFQANSRVVTTTDELLQEVVNLVR